MIIVADSGSTKTDWRIVDDRSGKTVHQVKSVGFNPYFQSTQIIVDILHPLFSEALNGNQDQIQSVFYYGAGCSSDDKKGIVRKALERIFPKAKIMIEHDLIGAARACLGDQPGIAGIIGTGSNSCQWDGQRIVHNIPSHGYIFGDEGSGSYLGREVLKLYLNNEMNEVMHNAFYEEYGLSEEEILEGTYKRPNPNVFLASFASFYSLFPDARELKKIIHLGFNEFFHRRVLKYPDYILYDLSFVGSIAYHFREELEAVANMHHVTVRSVDKCPVENLVKFHLEKSLTKI